MIFHYNSPGERIEKWRKGFALELLGRDGRDFDMPKDSWRRADFK
jgi:hypothetical protein